MNVPALRLPLYVKILGWFFLNIALVAAAVWLLARKEVTISAMPALSAQAAMARVAAELLPELEADPSPPAWDQVLEAASARHGVEFRLYGLDGHHVAGGNEPLPPSVHQPLFGRAQRRGPPRGEGRFGPGADGPARNGPPGPDGPNRPPPPREEPSGTRQAPRWNEMLRSADPPGFWIGVPMRITGVEEDLEDGVALVAASDSVTGHGFYFNTQPYIWGAAGILGLSLAIWVPFVRSLTRSLSRMQQSTREIAAGNFDARGDERRRDEVGALGRSINQMAEQLRGYVSGQKRFLSDVAHELSAPIARLRFGSEILETRVPASEAERVRDLQEEVAHMARLVNDLLQFSKAAMATESSPPAPTELAPLVQAAARLEAAPPGAIHIAIDPGLSVMAIPEALRRAVGNLLRNSLRYGGPQGPIHITAQPSGRRVILRITDEGPGIPEADLPRIFTPFFRPDQARESSTGGTGLGLAIVKSCVQACGGEIRLENRKPRGLLAEVTLERDPPARI